MTAMLAIDFPFYVKVRDWLETGTPAMLVEVQKAEGSTPREIGAAMAVSPKAYAGTIGGGQLEWLAMAEARRLIDANTENGEKSVPLGPELGQCCGGRVNLRFTRIDNKLLASLESMAKAGEARQPYVLVFGAGHTGKALADALSSLPLHASLVDPRPEMFEGFKTRAANLLTPLPEALVHKAKPGSAFVVMTHEHSLDFLIIAEALKRGDAAYCGMIGSKTKRAVFVNWLKENGYDEQIAARLVCPIGGNTVKDKRPEIIAALTAAEILTAFYGSGDSTR
jgi:xanthine dehydrogenase accessory factor